jgi:hypothetical protein
LLFAERCQAMNAASQAALVHLIQSINAYIPRIDFGPTNPNTGQTHHNFVIGAENSRFVDLKLHKSYLRHWTVADWQELGNFLYLLGHELYADINCVTEEDEQDYVYTFWWD